MRRNRHRECARKNCHTCGQIYKVLALRYHERTVQTHGNNHITFSFTADTIQRSRVQFPHGPATVMRARHAKSDR